MESSALHQRPSQRRRVTFTEQNDQVRFWESEATLTSKASSDLEQQRPERRDSQASVDIGRASFLSRSSVVLDTRDSIIDDVVPRRGDIPVKRLSIDVLDWLVEQGALEAGWRRATHRHLDFSDPKYFQLEVFQPYDFHWGGQEPREDSVTEFPVAKLETLNLDDNKLTDALVNFKDNKSLSGAIFGRLRVLRLKSNQLQYPVLLLPRLRELNLSKNKIKSLPRLEGLPSLEVLNLSHNEMTELDAERFTTTSSESRNPGKDCCPRSLRSLNFAGNKINIMPTALVELLNKWSKHLPHLTSVMLKDNPFCSYFGEYQCLVVRFLKELAQIDGISLSKNKHVREEMERDCSDFFGHVFKSAEGDETIVDRVDSFNGSVTRANEYLAKIGVHVEDLNEARHYFLHDRLPLIDEEIKKRKELRNKSFFPQTTNKPRRNDKRSDGLPKLVDLVRELDDAIVGHSAVASSVGLVFSMASSVPRAGPDRLPMLFDDQSQPGTTRRAVGEHARKAAKEELVATFVQQIELLYERNPTVRFLLARTIAKFASVPDHRLGELSIATLGTFAKNGDEATRQVLEVINEMVLPLITERDISDASCSTIILGLGNLHLSELSSILKDPFVQRLVRFSKGLICRKADGLSDGENPLRDALAALLHCAAKNREAAMKIITDPDGICVHIGFEQLTKDARLTDWTKYQLYEHLVGVLRSCIEYFPDETIQILKEGKGGDHSDLHFVLLKKVSGFLAEIKLGKLTPAHCKKIGAALELITDMMTDPQVRHNLGKGDKRNARENLLVSIALEIASSDNADPILLAASLRCMLMLISNEAWLRERFLELFILVLGLDGDNKILAYIEPERKFKEMYKRCELHLMQTEDSSEQGYLSVSAFVPEINACTNSIAHNTIVAVINFLNAFSVLAPEDDKCDEVSKELNRRGREHLLFQLLEFPSEAVTEAVVRCIGSTDISELDASEVEKLVSLLDASHIIREEALLKRVLGRLQRFLEVPGAAGDKFRTQFSKDVLKRTFQLLEKNAARPTYDNAQEEEQKVGLSVQGVSLLMSASHQPLLRRHFRSLDVVGDFQRILKCEEDLVHQTRPDICIELTWTGRHVEFLIDALGGKLGVTSSHKQGFRILHRIADVLVGVADPINKPPTSALERAKSEALMWDSRDMKWETSFLDDSVFADRTIQQQAFVSFSGLERCIHFVESRTFENGKANLQQAKKEQAKGSAYRGDPQSVMKQLLKHAADRETEIAAAAAEEKNRKNPITIFLDTDELDVQIPVEETLKYAFMQEGWQPIESNPSLTPAVPGTLRENELFTVPGTNQVSFSFLVAALLRIMYALLAMPAVERFHQETVVHLRNHGMLLRIKTLVEHCNSLVDCNVAAKFLRVMHEALRLPPGQPTADGEEYLVCLLIAAEFASRCLHLLAPTLESSCGAYPLTPHQQTLCTEAVRLMRSIATALCHVHVSKVAVVHWECVEKLLGYAIPLETVRCVFLCALYDMQLNIGSLHGRSITDKYARGTLERQGLRELCSEVLATILDACPQFRYDVIEFVSRYELIGKHHIRESFLSELLERVHMLKYRVAMEEMMMERDYADERILQCISVEIPVKGAFVLTQEEPQLLVLTTRRICFMARPKHGMLSKPCGVCPPESFCPVGPEIEKQYFYKDLTRIFCGPDPQMLVLGLLRRAVVPNRAGADRNGEEFVKLVCHKSDQRQAVVETLSALSGNCRIEACVEVVQDEVTRQAIGFHMRSARTPMCMNYAIRLLPSGIIGSMVGGGSVIGGNRRRLSLFMLAEEELFEFEVKLDYWAIPCIDFPFDLGEDDYGARVEFDGKEHASDDPVARFRQMRRTRRTYQTDMQELLSGPGASGLGFAQQATLDAAITPAEPSTPPIPNKRLEDVVTARERAKLYTIQNANSNVQTDGQAENGGTTNGKTTSTPGLTNAMKESKTRFLKLLARQPLEDLTGVTFDHGETPVVRLRFKGDGNRSEQVSVDIQFFDDTARERWRRGLAFVLNRPEYGIQWNRRWVHDAEVESESDVETSP